MNLAWTIASAVAGPLIGALRGVVLRTHVGFGPFLAGGALLITQAAGPGSVW